MFRSRYKQPRFVCERGVPEEERGRLFRLKKAALFAPIMTKFFSPCKDLVSMQ